MKTYTTSDLPEHLSSDEQLWLYNGLDVSITREVYDRLAESQPGGFAYDMPRQMQAPALAMMRRGVRIDVLARDEETKHLDRELARADYLFARLSAEGWGMETNWRSPAQLMELFYNRMGLEPVLIYDKLKRERRPAANIEALEKLHKRPYAQHLVDLILDMRRTKRLRDVLNSGLDPDGRLRCSYQVVGTMTGRWSSNDSAFHSGTNLQNLTDRARRIVVPDPGKVFVQNDLAQAESRMVAAISQDQAYRDACSSGDLHTTVCRMVWSDIGWPSDPNEHKTFADTTKYYRHFSYRDMAKRAGHASNYGGSPNVLAMHLKIEQKVAADFQTAYFKAFPGIRKWHAKVAAQLARNNTITTALGRRCHFYARPGDNSALKSAIAYEPQSLIGDVLNEGLARVWRQYELPGHLQLLLQVHDAICWQAPAATAADLIPQILETLQVPLDIYGYKFYIPSDATWGWNWGKAKYNKASKSWTNPAGQREFNPGASIHAPA